MRLLVLVACLMGSFEEDFRRGGELYRQGKYREALSVFEGLLKEEMEPKERVAVLANAAAAAYALALYHRAAQHLKTALKIDPKNRTLRLNLVRALALSGNHKEALRQLSQLDTSKEMAEYLKSAALANASTPSEVVTLRLLLAVGAGDSRVRERLVGLLLAQRRYQEASAEAEAWTKNEPENARAWFYLALSLVRRGEDEEAEDAAQIALSLGEERARGLVASILQRRGLTLSAAVVLSGSKDDGERMRAARLAVEAGAPEMALEILAGLNGKADGLRALALLRAGRKEKARELAHNVLKTDPQNEDARAVLEALKTQK